MGLFKPIWENKNPDKIRRFIDAADGRFMSCQEKLVGISLYCAVPELRHAAIRKIFYPDVAVSTMMKAKENGDIETAQALLDKDDFNIRDAVLASGDLELISLLALKTKTISEWNKYREAFEPLLNTPGFERAADHYGELKRIEDEERKAIARQKRKEAEARRHEAFLRDPREGLVKAAGKPSEKKLWKEWYEYQYKDSPGKLFWIITGQLRDLDWARYFPGEYLRATVLNSAHTYYGSDLLNLSEENHHVKRAQKNLHYFLRTLYDRREELREEILSLNGLIYYEPRGSTAVNFGDHHEDWFVTVDPEPGYKLSVFLSGQELQVLLEKIWQS